MTGTGFYDFFHTDSFLSCLKTDKEKKSEVKESAKMPTIKFHQPEDFTAPGPCPMGNRRQRERVSEREKERERALKRKRMGNRKRIYDG